MTEITEQEKAIYCVEAAIGECTGWRWHVDDDGKVQWEHPSLDGLHVRPGYATDINRLTSLLKSWCENEHGAYQIQAYVHTGDYIVVAHFEKEPPEGEGLPARMGNGSGSNPQLAILAAMVNYYGVADRVAELQKYFFPKIITNA